MPVSFLIDAAPLKHYDSTCDQMNRVKTAQQHECKTTRFLHSAQFDKVIIKIDKIQTNKLQIKSGTKFIRFMNKYAIMLLVNRPN